MDDCFTTNIFLKKSVLLPLLGNLESKLFATDHVRARLRDFWCIDPAVETSPHHRAAVAKRDGGVDSATQ
jgi:hypothetical protein